jgi:hypothetical protein
MSGVGRRHGSPRRVVMWPATGNEWRICVDDRP